LPLNRSKASIQPLGLPGQAAENRILARSYAAGSADSESKIERSTEGCRRRAVGQAGRDAKKQIKRCFQKVAESMTEKQLGEFASTGIQNKPGRVFD
jgi:hypothetical protein